MHHVVARAVIAGGFLTSLVAPANGQDRQTPSPDSSTIDVIALGLTTDRLRDQSGEGGFSAEVLAHSGLVAALYDCRAVIERVVTRWARDNRLRTQEKKADTERLYLVYASNAPPGYFILEYTVSSTLDKAKITFDFRTLANVRLSGEMMGLAALGPQLLQAIQCVPRR